MPNDIHRSESYQLPSPSLFQLNGHASNGHATGREDSASSRLSFNEERPPVSSVRAPSTFTETVTVRRPLGWSDILSLVLNKMVGTGIFTTPGLVLQATQSKTSSIILWAFGGVYSFLCVVVYLEFGQIYKFNGAELIYLDRAYDTESGNDLRPRFHTLLLPILFSGYIICLGHTAGNCIAFARHALEAALVFDPSRTSSDPDKRLVDFIAITVLSVVCLLHYRSRRLGLFLNRLLAAFKIGLLFTIFVAGTNARYNQNSGISDWGTQPLPTNTTGASIPTSTPTLIPTSTSTSVQQSAGSDADSSTDVLGSFSGFILVLYSYTGWENANYVAGEVGTHSAKKLRLGAFLAVSITAVLYTLAVMGYYLANDFDDIVQGNSDVKMAKIFPPAAFGSGASSTAFEVCICLSAFGNLIATVFTVSKVKQMIAVQNYLPFSRFFSRGSPFQTPEGGLALHWICSVIVVLATPNTSDGYGFILGLLTYGQLIITLLTVIRLPWLISTWYLGDPPKMPPKYHRPLVRNSAVAWSLAFLIGSCNLVAIGCSAISDGGNGSIARKYWAAVVFGVFGSAFLYWLIIVKGLQKFGASLGIRLDLRAATKKQKDEVRQILHVEDGTRWRLVWKRDEIWVGVTKKFSSWHEWMVDNVY